MLYITFRRIIRPTKSSFFFLLEKSAIHVFGESNAEFCKTDKTERILKYLAVLWTSDFVHVLDTLIVWNIKNITSLFTWI